LLYTKHSLCHILDGIINALFYMEIMFKKRKSGRARQLCFEQSVKKTDTAAVIWKQFAIGYGEVDPPRFERGSLF